MLLVATEEVLLGEMMIMFIIAISNKITLWVSTLGL